MDKEVLLNNFIKVLISVIKLNDQLEDRFFNDKMSQRINDFVCNFINYSSTNSKENSQQRNLIFYKLFAVIDSLNELTQDMLYLNLLKTSRLLLETKKGLLQFKLELITNKELFTSKELSENKNNFPEKNTNISKIEKKIKLNPSKQKILNFIKSSPNIRTKDIINEFSVLSDRTVKRNLTELLKTGMVKKKMDNKATYYSQTEGQ